MNWATEAVAALQAGQTVQVRPRGHSMTGRISDGELVTLVPCLPESLSIGDIVLVRIQGKRFSHIVLHCILSIDGERFLIGNQQGRVDGWVHGESIHGVVTQVETSE